MLVLLVTLNVLIQSHQTCLSNFFLFIYPLSKELKRCFVFLRSLNRRHAWTWTHLQHVWSSQVTWPNRTLYLSRVTHSVFRISSTFHLDGYLGGGGVLFTFFDGRVQSKPAFLYFRSVRTRGSFTVKLVSFINAVWHHQSSLEQQILV